MHPLTLGYSPCPNDTFIFHALTHGCVSSERITFKERLEDVETLNRLVLEKALDVSKVSYHLLGFIREDYCSSDPVEPSAAAAGRWWFQKSSRQWIN